jgi:anti-sigma B factor antagonist
MFGHRGSKHDMIHAVGERSLHRCRHRPFQERTPLSTNEGHRLHEVRVEGGVEPAGAFTVESCPAPVGISVVELSGELDIAATSAVRTRVDEAAGSRGLVLDLAGVTFLDSSMLKELLRAGAELERYETPLVLAGITPAVSRLLALTRTTELFTLAGDRAAALARLEG